MKENLNNITEQFLKKIRDYEGFDKQLINDTLSNLEKIKESYLSQYNGKYLRINTNIATTIYKVDGIQNAEGHYEEGYYINGTSITRKFYGGNGGRDYEIVHGDKLHISAKDWDSVKEVSKEIAEEFYNEYMKVINESKFIE